MSKKSKLKSSPSRLQRLWRNSQTKLWASIQASSAAILGSITAVSSIISSDAFKNVLDTLSVPWWVPTGIAVMALISYLAHGHDA